MSARTPDTARPTVPVNIILSVLQTVTLIQQDMATTLGAHRQARNMLTAQNKGQFIGGLIPPLTRIGQPAPVQ